MAYNRFKGGPPVPPVPGPYEFYFAEGTCRPGFDPYICIQNPGDNDADVKITYMKGDGTTEEQSAHRAGQLPLDGGRSRTRWARATTPPTTSQREGGVHQRRRR